MIEVKKSKIISAGLGVFATQDIPEKNIIGEYKGILINQEQFELLKDTRYVFELSKKIGKYYKIFYINATDPKYSNNLRYINGAKTKVQKKKINLYAYQYKEKIFYKTSRFIFKGEELLLDYGDSYWI